MPLLPIAFPPGIRHGGTELENKGRWYNANLVRFVQGSIMPVGGWRQQSQSAMTGKGRCIISWHDNSGDTWSAIGTESHLYAMNRDGAIYDITPSGFTAGRADASSSGGYGAGNYGTGYAYGTPVPDTNYILDATMWSLSNFGQYLVGCSPDDGNIYQWTLGTGTPAAVVSGAPSAVALLVTAEGMLMALGTANNPRLVQWCDQQNITTWTPTASNQAGNYQIGSNGRLMGGIPIKGANLIGTDVDVWVASYEANTFVYGFTKVGAQGCGFISRGCAIAVDAVANTWGAMAVWMGQNGFYLYNGYVLPLPCDVWDYVFNNLNELQKSKITCEMNSAFGEITWHYPSASSVEIDNYVTWNFRENTWSVGSVCRLSGVDAGVNAQYPLRVYTDGYVYEHEVGFAYSGGAMPFLESGPIELGNGDFAQDINMVIPDDQSIGNLEVYFFTRMAPGNSETKIGPFALAPYTGIRGVSGREVRVRFDGIANASWRLGIPKLDVVQGDAR